MTDLEDCTILLDMDGVVAHFTAQLAPLGHRNHDQPYCDPSDIQEFYGFRTMSEIWKAVDAQGEAFWADMPELPWARRLYSRLCELAPVVFCTSPAYNPVCAAGKVQWLQRFTGNRRIRDFVLTPRKHLLASDRTILIDDLDYNVQGFRQAGGQAILFPSSNNRLNQLFDPSGDPQIQYVLGELGVE